MNEARRGKRVVLALYLVVLAVAGGFGFVIGLIGPDDLRPVAYLGLIEFQPTPLGLAAYGVLTLGTLVGVLILLVEYVSRRYVDRPG